MASSTCKSSMHTQHVKFSTYVFGGGGEDVAAASLPSLSSLFFGRTSSKPAAAISVVLVAMGVVFPSCSSNILTSMGMYV